ncbi:MAG: diguanylate cyclase [Dissulfurispiraceae bacterium]|jgi:diguanylate cyclase (GGDEF)-like protein/PAS domain S-box-containing protein|nr:diguanylate cyclase [Dissulfurispiraceae bacterium]
MLFPRISDLMTTDVIAIPPYANLYEALEKLASFNVSSIVVTEGLKPVGIISEHSILRITATTQNIYRLPVRDHMFKNPVVVYMNDDIPSALRTMGEKNTKRLVVIDENGNMLGMLSCSDILNKLDDDFFGMELTVKAAVSDSFIQMPADAPLKLAIDRMYREEKNCVVAYENNRVSGILTERDIVRLLVKNISMDTPISQLCTQSIIYLNVDTPLAETRKIMRDRGARFIIILDQQLKLAGVVTPSDIVSLLNKNLNRGLQTLSDRYKKSLDMLSLGYIEFELNNEGTILAANRIAAEGLGFSSVGQIVCRSFAKLLKSQNQWEDFLSKRKNMPASLHMVFELKDQIIEGFFKITQFSASGIFRDVTADYIEKENIKTEKNRFENIVRTLSEGIVILDKSGVIRQANDTAADMFGLTQEDMIGKLFHQLECVIIDESGGIVDRQTMLASQMIKSLPNHKGIIRGIKRQDGSILWVTVNATPVINAAGEIEEIVKVVVDITEMYNLKKRNQKVLDTAQEGYWEMHLDGKIISANYTAAQLLGCTEDELVGKNIYDFAEDESREVIDKSLKNRAKGISGSYTAKLRRSDGRKIIIRQSEAPLTDAGGKVIGAFAFITDLTELTEANAELEMRHSMLEAINEATASYIKSENIKEPIEHLLKAAVKITSSQHGFVGYRVEGQRKSDMKLLAVSQSEGSAELSASGEQLVGDPSVTAEFMFIESLMCTVVNSKKPIISNTPSDQSKTGENTVNSFLAVPFFWNNKDMGFIALVNKPDGYTDNDADVVESMVKGIALILYREEERVASMQKDGLLNTIASFSKDLTRAMSESEAYEIFKHYLLSLKKGDARMNALYFLGIDHTNHTSELLIRHNDSGLRDINKCPGMEKCKAYVYTGTFIINDLSSDYACPFQRLGAESGSYMCTPVSLAGQTAGILHLYSRHPHFFGDNMKETIESFISIFAPVINNMRLLELNKKLAIIDPLTGLYNRRYFEAFMDKQVAISQRNNQFLSVIMLDIDNFKLFNDSYGHDAGDVALKLVAHLLNSVIRNSDIAVRYGGEEFIVALPNTEKAVAYEVAERLRATIEESPVCLNSDQCKFITASLGVATLGLDSQDMTSLISTADSILYNAKNSGKNRVCVA